ncbi:polyamine aminopropyltransferase [Thermosynechococcus sp.]|uniref:polyamine aminopropyltransferase n=1 Tax=Thermosynechococcus sp. TaxID=2814275 RepID=UPI00391BA4FA
MTTHHLYLLEQLNAAAGYFIRADRCLFTKKTRYQELALYESAHFGKFLCLDHLFMTSEADEFFYHENLIHPAAITHPAPRSALIIGGGDGGAAEEVLKYPTIEQVVLAELDEEVVEVCRQHLDTIHRGAFEDPRLKLMIGDGRAYLENTSAQFDLIILDLTDPQGPSLNLYTQEFYHVCKQHLAAAGLLALHVESPIARPTTYARLVTTLRQVFPIVRPYSVYIPLYGTLWGMATASESCDPCTLTAAEVEQRIATRGISDLRFYNGETHRGVFALPNFIRTLLSRPVAPLTDEDTTLEEELPTSRLKIIPQV